MSSPSDAPRVTGRSWVLNLARRTDRRDRFVARYARHGPDLELTIVEAVDGTKPDPRGAHPLDHCVAVGGADDGRNPRVRATVLSHLLAWQRIAESDADYGLVFEDDVCFREDDAFRRLWPRISHAFPPDVMTGAAIVYFGLGSRLPPENGASPAWHVTAQPVPHFGPPRLGGPYVFEWLGAFSYALSRRGAQRLLDEVARSPIDRAADQWLKMRFADARHATVPLLTYHPPYDVAAYDSDIWGLPAPVDAPRAAAVPRAAHRIAFLIPARGEGSPVDAVVGSIIATMRGDLDVHVVIACADAEVLSVRAACERLMSRGELTVVDVGRGDAPCVEGVYDRLARVALAAGADLLALWDDATRLDTPHWDVCLLAHHDILFESGEEAVACFQLPDAGASRATSPILTRAFAQTIADGLATPWVRPFVALAALLARVAIFVRTIQTARVPDDDETRAAGESALIDALTASPEAKRAVDRAIAGIRAASAYRPCGAWVAVPAGWSSHDVIGTMADELPGLRAPRR